MLEKSMTPTTPPQEEHWTNSSLYAESLGAASFTSKVWFPHLMHVEEAITMSPFQICFDHIKNGEDCNVKN
jgi:hypothetical protein